MGNSNNEEPSAKKAKTTSSSRLSDALFGQAASTSGDARASEAGASSLSAALFGGGGGGQDTNEETVVAAEAMVSKPPPFDVTNSARFASQASKLRRRNLANEELEGPGDDSGGMDGKEAEVQVPAESDDDGNEVEEVADQYSSDEYEQEEEEKEGPDGLTNSERLYLQREYETTTLTEREWLIHQRRRRRLGCDAQIQTLNLCTETVGVGSMMPVKLWRDSAPGVVAAKRKAAAAAGNADDPDMYDLINSDDEGEGERVLVLKRQQALSMCQTIMSNVGILIIRNSTQQPSAASVSETDLDSDVEFVCTSGGDSAVAIDGDVQEPIIPTDLMDELVAAAREIELELCERLSEKGKKWRALEEADGGAKMTLDGASENADACRSSVVLVDSTPEDEMKMPSKETAAKEEEDRRKRTETDGSAETGINFRCLEAASRCIGRIDSRYRMDEYPFNDPRVISNPVLLPIIKHMLGGENGNAELVYAGLIFSFPGSQNQPWHQDGEPLFPEEDMLDVPSYAFNVFIPLDDVTDELGPTQFLPGTLLSERAEEVNEELMQWAMIESKWSAAGDHKASMRMVLGAEEDEWMSRNKVVAPLLRRGDVMMYDYRTCHRGTENLSQSKTRTMLYLMYARPWLKEHLNFGTEKLFGDKNASASI